MLNTIHLTARNQYFRAGARPNFFSFSSRDNVYRVDMIRKIVPSGAVDGAILTEDGDFITTEGGDTLVIES